jgi:ATP synthase F subunit
LVKFRIFKIYVFIKIAEMIRGTVDGHDKSLPAVLEIPSKEHPYDASKDSILRRARVSFHEEKGFFNKVLAFI